MKTTFTADDIGKTFATNQEGVTAKFLGFFESNKQYPCRWEYSNGGYWFTDYLGRAFKEEYNVLPDKEIISESDLLRKEIEELKAKHEADLRTAVKLARASDLFQNVQTYLHEPDEIIQKIVGK